MVEAQWRQDYFHQGDSAAHFDNCAFIAGTQRIQQEVAAAKKVAATCETNPKCDAEALLALGRALHAIQDFYAHSTYLDQKDDDASLTADFETAVPVVAIWKDDGQKQMEALMRGGLISGTWLFWPLASPRECDSKTAKSHGALAKDGLKGAGLTRMKHTAWADTRHEAALKLAVRASTAFLSDALPMNLRARCGQIAVTLVPDRRHEQPAP